MDSDLVVQNSLPTVHLILDRLAKRFGTLVLVPVERKPSDSIESHQRRFCARLAAQDVGSPPSCAFVGGPFFYRFDNEDEVSLIACLGVPKLQVLFYVRGTSIAATGLSAVDVCASIDIIPDKQPNLSAVAALKRAKRQRRKV